MELLIRRNAEKIRRDKKVEITLRIIGAVIFAMVLFSSDEWKFLLYFALCFTIARTLPLDRNSPDAMVPHVELRDGVVIVNEDRISLEDIDVSQSHMTKKKLTLYSKSAQWKNTIKANLSFLMEDDVEALRQVIWGQG